jgi:hypothetical protein
MDAMPILTFHMSQAGAPIRWSEVIIACDNGMMQPAVREAVQSVETQWGHSSRCGAGGMDRRH